jgi:phosphatidylethanolamine-binding protein (PEBP) family uncharacterized protein
MVDGAVQAANSGGQPGWQPFCPPAGETHRYQFVLYALATPSGITEGMPTAAALEVFDQRTDPTAALSVLFNLDAAP